MNEKLLKETAEDLLDKLDIEATVEAVVKEGENPQIHIETTEAGILIGFHGETLRSFELVLSFLVSQKVGEFTRVGVDVGGYKKQKEEKLLEFAKTIKEQVLSEGKEIPIPNLTAQERRIVHLYFQDDKDVTTESQGENELRLLIVKPR